MRIEVSKLCTERLSMNARAIEDTINITAQAYCVAIRFSFINLFKSLNTINYRQKRVGIQTRIPNPPYYDSGKEKP